MSVTSQQIEPTHDRPAWVLTYRGMRYGLVKLILREYRWMGESWRPTDTPVEHPRSLYAALEKADYVGRLPKQGRRRSAFTHENLDAVRQLLALGVNSLSRIAAETGISKPIVRKLVEFAKK